MLGIFLIVFFQQWHYFIIFTGFEYFCHSDSGAFPDQTHDSYPSVLKAIQTVNQQVCTLWPRSILAAWRLAIGSSQYYFWQNDLSWCQPQTTWPLTDYEAPPSNLTAIAHRKQLQGCKFTVPVIRLLDIQELSWSLTSHSARHSSNVKPSGGFGWTKTE